jgi:hypothetical protein
MELREALTQAVRELHGSEQESTSTGDAMRQEPPLERLVVLPGGVLRINEEALVMAENVSGHQANERKKEILRPRQ